MLRVESITLRVPWHVPKAIWWSALAIGVYVLAYALAKGQVGTDFGDFPESLEAGIAGPLDTAFRWTADNLDWFFKPISNVISAFLSRVEDFLLWLPWPAGVAVVVLAALRVSGRKMGLFCGISLLFIGMLGLWDSAMITLSIMGVSVLISVAIAVPLGIAAASSDRVESWMRPVLDTLQVMPAFVWLMPALFLFGVSGTQAVFLTVVYAIPPAIRLTNLGIRQVPPAIIETARSHGSARLQTLFQVQLPLAKPSIMMGVNQTVMMAMAMVVITALVGSGGLGRDVWQALRQVNTGAGLESGIAIVLLAVMLDRLSYAMARQSHVAAGPGEASAGQRRTVDGNTGSSNGALDILLRHRSLAAGAGLVVILMAVGAIGGGLKEFPDGWEFSFAEPVNDAVGWMSVNLHFMTSWIRDSVIREFGMAPAEAFLFWLPWPALVVGAALIAYFAAGKGVAVFTALALLFIGIGGVWELAMETLSQVLVAGVFCIILGIVIGVWCSQSRAVQSVVQPILDIMQTMPIFVYLIPVIMLWGIGPLVGIIATLVYALPPMIRMTSLGIRQVPPEVVETSISHGATRLQTLVQVRFPLALPSIMMGVNQTVMMVLAMVIIGGLVGGGGLGQQVYFDSVYLNMGSGLIAGASIVLMATILDRVTQGRRAQQGAAATP